MPATAAAFVMATWAPLLLPFLGISLPAWIMTWASHRAMRGVTESAPATRTPNVG